MVCEMDAKGALAAAFDVGPLDFDPKEVVDNLWAMEMNTEDSLREYLRLFVRIPLLGRIGPLAKTLDFIADAAPGGEQCECGSDRRLPDAALTGDEDEPSIEDRRAVHQPPNPIRRSPSAVPISM